MRYVSFWQKKKIYRHKTSSEFFLFLLRQHFFICTLPYRRTCTNGRIYIASAATSHTHTGICASFHHLIPRTSYQVLTQPNGIIQLEEAKKEGKKLLSIYRFPHFSVKLFFFQIILLYEPYTYTHIGRVSSLAYVDFGPHRISSAPHGAPHYMHALPPPSMFRVVHVCLDTAARVFSVYFFSSNPLVFSAATSILIQRWLVRGVYPSIQQQHQSSTLFLCVRALLPVICWTARLIDIVHKIGNRHPPLCIFLPQSLYVCHYLRTHQHITPNSFFDQCDGLSYTYIGSCTHHMYRLIVYLQFLRASP